LHPPFAASRVNSEVLLFAPSPGMTAQVVVG